MRAWAAGPRESRAHYKFPKTITAIAVSPSLVAVAGYHTEVHLLTPQSLDIVGKLSHSEINAPNVTVIAFSEKGDILVSGANDGTVRLSNLETGDPEGVLRREGAVNSVAISSNGKWVLAGGMDGSARLWDWEKSGIFRDVGHDGAEPLSVAFSQDGKYFLTRDSFAVRVWSTAAVLEQGGNAQPMKLAHPVPNGEDVGKSIYFAKFSPVRPYYRVLTGGYDGSAIVWDGYTRNKISTYQHEGPVTAGAFSGNGSHIITATDGGRKGTRMIKVWNAMRQLNPKLSGVALACKLAEDQLGGEYSWRRKSLKDMADAFAESLHVALGDPKVSLAVDPEGRFIRADIHGVKNVIANIGISANKQTIRKKKDELGKATAHLGFRITAGEDCPLKPVDVKLVTKTTVYTKGAVLAQASRLARTAPYLLTALPHRKYWRSDTLHDYVYDKVYSYTRSHSARYRMTPLLRPGTGGNEPLFPAVKMIN